MDEYNTLFSSVALAAVVQSPNLQVQLFQTVFVILQKYRIYTLYPPPPLAFPLPCASFLTLLCKVGDGDMATGRGKNMHTHTYTHVHIRGEALMPYAWLQPFVVQWAESWLGAERRGGGEEKQGGV